MILGCIDGPVYGGSQLARGGALDENFIVSGICLPIGRACLFGVVPVGANIRGKYDRVPRLISYGKRFGISASTTADKTSGSRILICCPC